MNSPLSGRIENHYFDSVFFMSEVFQISCPHCHRKLNAKVSLIGQTRNCPVCKTPIEILQRYNIDAPEEELSSSPSDGVITMRPPQLSFHHRYFILGLDRLVAVWECNKGWHVNVGTGFAPARSNMAAIPDQGVFAFVEMVMESGLPKRLLISRIASRGALTVLCREAHAILGKLEEHIELTAIQKDVLLRHMRLTFMSSVLDGADQIINYLTSPTH